MDSFIGFQIDESGFGSQSKVLLEPSREALNNARNIFERCLGRGPFNYVQIPFKL